MSLQVSLRAETLDQSTGTMSYDQGAHENFYSPIMWEAPPAPRTEYISSIELVQASSLKPAQASSLEAVATQPVLTPVNGPRLTYNKIPEQTPHIHLLSMKRYSTWIRQQQPRERYLEGRRQSQSPRKVGFWNLPASCSRYQLSAASSPYLPPKRTKKNQTGPPSPTSTPFSPS